MTNSVANGEKSSLIAAEKLFQPVAHASVPWVKGGAALKLFRPIAVDAVSDRRSSRSSTGRGASARPSTTFDRTYEFEPTRQLAFEKALFDNCEELTAATDTMERTRSGSWRAPRLSSEITAPGGLLAEAKDFARCAKDRARVDHATAHHTVYACTPPQRPAVTPTRPAPCSPLSAQRPPCLPHSSVLCPSDDLFRGDDDQDRKDFLVFSRKCIEHLPLEYFAEQLSPTAMATLKAKRAAVQSAGSSATPAILDLVIAMGCIASSGGWW